MRVHLDLCTCALCWESLHGMKVVIELATLLADIKEEIFVATLKSFSSVVEGTLNCSLCDHTLERQ